MSRRFGHVLVAMVIVAGCGAYDHNAAPLADTGACTPVEARLSTFLELLDQGRLAGLRSVTQNDFMHDQRTRLIDALIKVIDALPPGTISGLKALIDSGQTDNLAGGLGGVLAAIDDYEGLGIVRKMLEQCTGKPLLVTLEGLLADEAFVAELLALADTEIALPIDFSQVENRAGFQALMRALLTSISTPGFDVADITAVVPQLESLLVPLLAPGEPLMSVQLVTGCLLEADPQDALAGLLFDVIRAAPEPIPLDLFAGGIQETLDRIALPILRLLIGDDVVRGSLVIGMSVLFRPNVAEKFVPDLVQLIEAGAVDELMDVLVTLAVGGC